MAVGNYSVTEDRAHPRSSYIVTWAGLANGDTGQPILLLQFADRSFQVEGTFGASGACACEGSNDGSNFHALHDHFGASASLSSGGIAGISEVTAYVQPHVTAGDGTTALTVTMFLRRTA